MSAGFEIIVASCLGSIAVSLIVIAGRLLALVHVVEAHHPAAPAVVAD